MKNLSESMSTFYCKTTFLFLTFWIYVVVWIHIHFRHQIVRLKELKDYSDKGSNFSSFSNILENGNNLSNIQFGRFQKTSEYSNSGLFCTIQSQWYLRYFSKTVTTQFKSWTYKEKQNCSSFHLDQIPGLLQNFTFSIKCEDDGVKVLEKSTDDKSFSNDTVFNVEFGDPCLRNYINKCCKDNLPIPNVVHYVIYNKDNLTFFEFVSFISVIRFIRPCAILIHGDKLPTGFYWSYILTLSPNIVHVRRDPPSKIFGKKTTFKEHASDLMRIEALIMYGGIYLDTDTVIVKSLEPLRKYPCTMSLQSSGYMSSAFVMAEQNATFLQKWLDGYKYHYNAGNYVRNAMVYPKLLANKNKDLIHIEYGKLSRPWTQIGYMIYRTNCRWKGIYGIHLFSRAYRKHMDTDIVKHFNSTVGSICRHVLFGNKELCLTG